MSHRSARRTLLSVALLPLLMAAACGGSPPAEPEPAATDAIAYEGARIIVGDGTVLDSGTLLVEQDRLLAVGPSNAMTVPDGAERVDLPDGRSSRPSSIPTSICGRTSESHSSKTCSARPTTAQAQCSAWVVASVTSRSICKQIQSEAPPTITLSAAASRLPSQDVLRSRAGSRPKRKRERRCVSSARRMSRW